MELKNLLTRDQWNEPYARNSVMSKIELGEFHVTDKNKCKHMKIKDNISVSESGFIFDGSTGDSYSLNPTGLEILNLIKEGRTELEIEEYFMMKYEVTSELFKRHLDDYIQMLSHYRLISNE